ncbi:glycoside hydrolase family 3 N-terminal domain-containing protein [Listeria ilorinensis]|uniref:glycoside hydrolase family 3 N-terminal domain-containing protein n=1 Tax=Listeria ilorinensis TaxID=2867439 RepID=UPI001EF5707E|nr:glycoside hydrolase family 3 N-terminal domain-containing protein [Listeria ilorinensis]
MEKRELEALLEKMTLSEKVCQLEQLVPAFFEGALNNGETTGPLIARKSDFTSEEMHSIGSSLGTGSAEEVIAIQEKHLENNRLGIPLLFMADVIHGFRTMFPIPLGVGASFDPQIAEDCAKMAAREAAEAGTHVTFSPMADLVRDPRWGRVMESTGEDAYLNGELAAAFVKGYQGDDLKNDFDRIASCVKHFAAYGAPEGGREYNTVDISRQALKNDYLPAYQKALEAGAKMVMTSFNLFEGIPATGNKYLMREILRDEWGFDGVLISDWASVGELFNHGVAETPEEAAELAIKAGLDIEMMTTNYLKGLEKLIEAGKIDEQLVDEAVMRVLELKNDLGLFEDPYRGLHARSEQKTLSTEHRQVVRTAAAESSVLLKNDGALLPLATEQKIALVGPFATTDDLLGGWVCCGRRDEAVTLETGVKERFSHAAICGTEDPLTFSLDELTAINKAAADAEVIVAALGEPSAWGGEAASRSEITLPKAQIDLLRDLKETGKPVVALIFNSRPLDLRDVKELADAIVIHWFPGTEAGHAVADLLSGDVNPSGRLPMSFPYNTGQIPVYYNGHNTGRPVTASDADPHYSSKYLDIPNEPLYPFGFGLSYTTFAYQDLLLSTKDWCSGESLEVAVTVKNTGDTAGKETIQLYLRDVVAHISRPLKELKRFEKVALVAGEEKTIHFTLTEEDLAYFDFDEEKRIDSGAFEIYVGPNSVSGLKDTFYFDVRK